MKLTKDVRTALAQADSDFGQAVADRTAHLRKERAKGNDTGEGSELLTRDAALLGVVCDRLAEELIDLERRDLIPGMPAAERDQAVLQIVAETNLNARPGTAGANRPERSGPYPEPARAEESRHFDIKLPGRDKI